MDAARSAMPNNSSDLDLLTVHVEEEGDAAVKNIIGSSELVLRWADKGKLRDKSEIMIGYLDPERKTFLDKLLKVRPPSPPLPVYASKLHVPSPVLQDARVAMLEKDSEDGSDDGASEDNHWKTAHFYFGASMSAEGEQYSKVLFCNDTQDDVP
jgi:DNA cross-link repair 1C protein